MNLNDYIKISCKLCLQSYIKLGENMKYRVSTLELLSKINIIIKDLVKINNNNPYNMDITITNLIGRDLLGDNYSANVVIQFNEVKETLNKQVEMLMELKGVEQKAPSEIKIVYDKKQELLELFETYKCGNCALNFYETGSHIEFLVSMSGYEQFNNIEITCPGINTEILTLDTNYYIFDIRNSKKEYIKYEKLISIKKQENTTEYEFLFENIEKPFVTYTRGNVNDFQKIMRRMDYIVFEKNKEDFIKNSLKLITRQLENRNEDLYNVYLEIAEKIIKL